MVHVLSRRPLGRRGNVRHCLRETRRRLIVEGYQGGMAKTSKGGGCVELERLGEGGGRVREG